MQHPVSAFARVLNPFRLTRYARATQPIELDRPAASEPQFTGLVRFLRDQRRVFGIGAAVATFGLFSVAALPAAAAPVVEQAEVAKGQSLEVAAKVVEPDTTRDTFAISYFTPVSWPIPPASHLSSGFGSRHAPCRGCSSFHEGLDWTPGAGYPIQAIADGVVVEAGNGGGLGVHVFIQHNVDGEIVTSGYGHMQRGSMNLAVGQTVTRGTVIGRVGNTGASTGAHLHFILEHGNAPFDPLPWLRQHVNS